MFNPICDFEEEIGKALITTKALLLFRPGEACGLLESIFQPIAQVCGSFRLVVTFGSREYVSCFRDTLLAALLLYRNLCVTTISHYGQHFQF